MTATYINAMSWPIWQVASIAPKYVSTQCIQRCTDRSTVYQHTGVYSNAPIEVCQHTLSGAYSDNVMIIHLSDSLP